MIETAGPKRQVAGAILIGALIWAIAMASSAAFGLFRREWQTQSHIWAISALFFIGGLLAFPLVALLCKWPARRWTRERRAALGFVALAVLTIGITAFIFALQYRLYYSEWHDDHLSVRWLLENGFTTLAAMYQFAVMGMALFLPLGLIALIAAALWFAHSRD